MLHLPVTLLQEYMNFPNEGCILLNHFEVTVIEIWCYMSKSTAVFL